MKLPYTPANVLHRHGGKVTKITRIKIQMERPSGGHSQDCWYFIGAVEWFDGSGCEDHPIDMRCLCADTPEGMEEIRGLSDLMMAYLADHGEWCDGKPHEGWYAHRPAKKSGPVRDSTGRLMAAVGPLK